MATSAFGKSFEKSFQTGFATGSATALEGIKEKNKLEREKLENKIAIQDTLDVGRKIIEQSGDEKAMADFETLAKDVKTKDSASIIVKSIQDRIKDQQSIQTKATQSGFDAASKAFGDVVNQAVERGGMNSEQAANLLYEGNQRLRKQFFGEQTGQPDSNTQQPTDFFTKEIPSKASQEAVAESAKVEARKTAEKNVARNELRNELDDFFLLDDQVPRSEGGVIERTIQGISNVASSMQQNTATGFALATHDAARKRLRVKLVRAAGDVGNINIVEQQAAEQIIPTQWDSKGTAELKRAFLKEASTKIESIEDGPKLESEIKKILNKFAESEAFRGPKGEEANKLKKKYKVGDTLEFGGKKYRAKTSGFDPELEIIE